MAFDLTQLASALADAMKQGAPAGGNPSDITATQSPAQVAPQPAQTTPDFSNEAPLASAPGGTPNPPSVSAVAAPPPMSRRDKILSVLAGLSQAGAGFARGYKTGVQDPRITMQENEQEIQRQHLGTQLALAMAQMKLLNQYRQAQLELGGRRADIAEQRANTGDVRATLQALQQGRNPVTGQPITDPAELTLLQQAGLAKTQAQTELAQANTKRAGIEPAVQDVRRYRDIQQRAALGQPISPEDQAWSKGYEKEKTLGAEVAGKYGIARMNILADPRWAALDVQKNRMVAPYIQTYFDAAKIDDLANKVMDTVKQHGGTITGPEFMQLLSYHMAGTFGAVKGARTGIDMIHEHVNSRPWSESLEAMYRKAVEGGNVSMAQAQEWQQLAGQRRDVMYETAVRATDLFGSTMNTQGLEPGRNIPNRPLPPGGGRSPGAPPPMGAPPKNLLKEGVHTTFKNGQTWTLQNDVPVQVK